MVRGSTPGAARVTGWSVHLPGADPAPQGLPPTLAGIVTDACSPERAATVLGRKGLLGKEAATRLALLAVRAAFPGAPERARAPLSPRTAVVACSNLGNVETVVKVARDVRAGGVRDVSPLDAPNVSSNVVASAVALWFGLGGPNVMVCSGAVAGIDALDIALRMLRAGRADRVVLVGAEPDDDVAAAVHADPARRGPRTGGGRSLRAGAACLVLEPPGAVPADPPAAALTIGRLGFDPQVAWGDCYGAQGVVSLALAGAAVAAGRVPSVQVTCGDQADGFRGAAVWAGGEDA